MDKMELLKHMLESGGEVHELVVLVGGEEVVFRYKSLGYLAKSACVSAAMEYVPEVNAGGQVDIKARLHLDAYKRMALKEMFGGKELSNPVPVTDALLNALSVEIGEQFDSVIPDPFTTPSQVGALKKEPEDSSEESGL